MDERATRANQEQMAITNDAVFGGGWFWSTEAVFEQREGVVSVMPVTESAIEQRPVLSRPLFA